MTITSPIDCSRFFFFFEIVNSISLIHEYFSQAMLVFINFAFLHACGKKSGVTQPATEIKCGPLR